MLSLVEVGGGLGCTPNSERDKGLRSRKKQGREWREVASSHPIYLYCTTAACLPYTLTPPCCPASTCIPALPWPQECCCLSADYAAQPAAGEPSPDRAVTSLHNSPPSHLGCCGPAVVLLPYCQAGPWQGAIPPHKWHRYTPHALLLRQSACLVMAARGLLMPSCCCCAAPWRGSIGATRRPR